MFKHYFSNTSFSVTQTPDSLFLVTWFMRLHFYSLFTIFFRLAYFHHYCCYYYYLSFVTCFFPLSDMELTMQTRLDLNSQRSVCLRLSSAGIKEVTAISFLLELLTWPRKELGSTHDSLTWVGVGVPSWPLQVELEFQVFLWYLLGSTASWVKGFCLPSLLSLGSFGIHEAVCFSIAPKLIM